MSVFQLNSIGATAPAGAPTLKPGYQWFPYSDSKGAALTKCPSAATQAGRGCYMIGGKAYGQRPIDDNEFGSTPLTKDAPPSSFTLNVPRLKVNCDSVWISWLRAHPEQYSCASSQAAKTAFTSLCNDVNNGRKTQAQADAGWKTWLAFNCATSHPPPPPAQTMPPPSNVKQPPVPPPASPPPGHMVNPPPVPPMLDNPSDQPPPVTQHRSPLQQIGPIVGIGLLAAIGLTMARKMKKGRLTKRRHRR